MKKITSCLFLLCLTACSHTPPPKPTTPTQRASLSKLKQLVGKWGVVGKDPQKFHIDFSLTSRGSVLVESWISKGKVHSLTLYHQDHNQLMATHYCPQGNQPRMVHTQATQKDVVAFTYKNATNLTPSKQSYQIEVSFDFSNTDNTVVRGEVYQTPKGPEKSSLRLQRLPTQ